MLSKEDQKILEEFSLRVHRRFSEARIWAFGSRVRGAAAWDSDFDVCVVVDHIDPASDKWIRKIAWEVGFENERVITTIVMDKEQFTNGPMSESTLVANILREGTAS